MEQVVGVAFVCVLEAEVVNDEDKDEWSPIVAPESRCDGTLVVTVFGKSRGEEVIGELSGLLEAVDAFVNFEVDPTIVCVFGEVVLVDEFLWDIGESDADVFRMVERRAEIEVGDVKATHACLGGGEDIVEHEFDEFK